MNNDTENIPLLQGDQAVAIAAPRTPRRVRAGRAVVQGVNTALDALRAHPPRAVVPPPADQQGDEGNGEGWWETAPAAVVMTLWVPLWFIALASWLVAAVFDTILRVGRSLPDPAYWQQLARYTAGGLRVVVARGDTLVFGSGRRVADEGFTLANNASRALKVMEGSIMIIGALATFAGDWLVEQALTGGEVFLAIIPYELLLIMILTALAVSCLRMVRTYIARGVPDEVVEDRVTPLAPGLPSTVAQLQLDSTARPTPLGNRAFNGTFRLIGQDAKAIGSSLHEALAIRMIGFNEPIYERSWQRQTAEWLAGIAKREGYTITLDNLSTLRFAPWDSVHDVAPEREEEDETPDYNPTELGIYYLRSVISNAVMTSGTFLAAHITAQQELDRQSYDSDWVAYWLRQGYAGGVPPLKDRLIHQWRLFAVRNNLCAPRPPRE